MVNIVLMAVERKRAVVRPLCYDISANKGCFAVVSGSREQLVVVGGFPEAKETE